MTSKFVEKSIDFSVGQTDFYVGAGNTRASKASDKSTNMLSTYNLNTV